ncbi:MAG: nuclear transport factor 2 family protein [Bacteroidia bacterium]|nr:nuclear transport factor 2 family protein [Bacteroidia bacterium]
MLNIIEKFYTAFSNLDGDAMAACYDRDVVFHDPAFGELKGEHAGNMWRMLCASQKDKGFKVEATNIQLQDHSGSAHWEAWYTFSQTGRGVHNVIEASFEIKDGKIIRHVDDFDLYRWSRQAMGVTGFLIGWTGFFKNKLQKQTNNMLSKWEARHTS